MTTKKTASQLAAERLGFGRDPHDDVLGDVETLLGRDEWGEDDISAARAALDRAKKLPAREPEPEPEKPEPRRATASELAAESLSSQSRSAARRGRGWNR